MGYEIEDYHGDNFLWQQKIQMDEEIYDWHWDTKGSTPGTLLYGHRRKA